MRKKFSIACLLFAWLCANGALLDAVQVFAWGKMFSDNTRTMDVATALRATFDPAKACELCVSVATAKDTAARELPTTVERAADKLVLALHVPTAPVFVAAPADWPATLASVAPTRTEAVPVPPPRA